MCSLKGCAAGADTPCPSRPRECKVDKRRAPHHRHASAALPTLRSFVSPGLRQFRTQTVNMRLLQKCRPAKPLPPFDGSQAIPVRSLIALAELRMESNPGYYKTSARKIAYLTSSFTGRAGLWVSNQYRESLGADPIFKAYEEFKRMLLCYFDSCDTKLGQVIHCKQRGSVDEYAERWSRAIAELEDDVCRQSEILVFFTDQQGRLRRSVVQKQSLQIDANLRYWRMWWVYGLEAEIQAGVLADFHHLRYFEDVVMRAITLEQQLYDAAPTVVEKKHRRTTAPMYDLVSWVAVRLDRAPSAKKKGDSFVAVDDPPASRRSSRRRIKRKIDDTAHIAQPTRKPSEVRPLLHYQYAPTFSSSYSTLI